MIDGESESTEEGGQPGGKTDEEMLASLPSWAQDEFQHLQRMVTGRGHEQERLRREAARLVQENWDLSQRLDALDAQAKELHEEVFQLNDAAERRCEPWKGPYDDSAVEANPKEVRYPEDEYNGAWEAARRKGEEPPSWETYWDKRQYVSQGLRNGDMHEGNFTETFRFEPAVRLHPERADHIQVAWFQCVTHSCRYHFKDKFEADHWPIRQTPGSYTHLTLPTTLPV